MNKKFSTLIAAFLAVGSFVSVEAGVVKITTPKTGQNYVIAAGDITASPDVAALTGTGTTLAKEDVNTSTDFVDRFLFTYGAGVNLTAKSGSNTITINSTIAYELNGTAATDLTKEDGSVGTGSIRLYNGSSWLSVTATSNIENSSATAASDLYLHAVTANLAAATDAYIKIGDNYLVRVGGDVKLLPEMEAVLYGAESAQWDIQANGTINPKDATATKLSYDEAAKTFVLIKSGVAGAKIEMANGSVIVNDQFVKADGTLSALDADGADYVTTALPQITDPGTAGLDVVTYPEYGVITDTWALLHWYESSNGAKFISKADASSPIATIGDYAAATDKTAFYWKLTKNSNGTYSLTNKNGGIFNVASVATSFNLVKIGTDKFALVANGKYVKATTAPALTLDGTSADAAVFTMVVAPEANFTADFLKAKTSDSFSLLLQHLNADGSKDLESNPFTSNLTPMLPVNASGNVTIGTDVADFKEAGSTVDNGAQAYLYKRADGKYIVLNLKDKWSTTITTDAQDGGYKFTVLTKNNLVKYLNANLANTSYAPYFQISYSKAELDKTGTPNDKTPIKLIRVGATSSSLDYIMGSFQNDKKYYLTVDAKPIYATFDNLSLVHGKLDKNGNPLLLNYVSITFKNHPSVKYNNVLLNGMVLGIDEDGDVAPVLASEYLTAKPEGQWTVQIQNNGVDDTNFRFVNRENSKVYDVDYMYYLGDDTYSVEGQFAGSRDTVVIKLADSRLNNCVQVENNYYADYQAKDIKDKQFRLTVASIKDFFVTEKNHNENHLLGLSEDAADAITWEIVPMNAERTFNADGDLKTPTDSVYVINNPGYYKADGSYKTYTDTLAMVSYLLRNSQNGEYLSYENPQTQRIQSMICDPKSKGATTSDLKAAYRFVLKQKADGKFSLIGVTESDEYYELNLDNKLYGATTNVKDGAVEVEKAWKQVNSNDLFNLVEVAAPRYRKVAMEETIRIFREENAKDVVFEKGLFLNVGNSVQFPEITPALYVDTAYVTRGHNTRYQYLLGVNINRVDELPCTEPNHPKIHPDTTYGRFLVNLIDTAYLTYKRGAIHENMYINDNEAGEQFAKLGFVYGFHTGDKLFITDSKFNKTGDEIDMSTNDFNVAKFAFRFVNPSETSSDKSFKIQTAYVDYGKYVDSDKRPAATSEGYIKNINGVLVVANNYEAGEVFNMDENESGKPVANEGLNASEVSVIASEGKVIINGAQGKTVVITNVLGQTIANTVLSSDNVTISAPAGIVVVAVEGEAAVKAIVK